MKATCAICNKQHSLNKLRFAMEIISSDILRHSEINREDMICQVCERENLELIYAK